MRLVYDYLFTVLWVAFVVYWTLAGFNTKTTERLEPMASRVTRTVLFVAGILLLTFPMPAAWLNFQLWPSAKPGFWAGAALTVAGLGFCVFARAHLGRNWSRSVAIKQDHELIDSGPYALVRHPIYTGLLVAFIGAVVAIGQIRAVAAFALIVLSLWYKLRLEEKWMREQFGANYEAYSGRVKALLPGVL